MNNCIFCDIVNNKLSKNIDFCSIKQGYFFGFQKSLILVKKTKIIKKCLVINALYLGCHSEKESKTSKISKNKSFASAVLCLKQAHSQKNFKIIFIFKNTLILSFFAYLCVCCFAQSVFKISRQRYFTQRCKSCYFLISS